MRTIIIIILLFYAYCTAEGQRIDKTDSNVARCLVTCRCAIKNNSNEDYLTWVSPFPVASYTNERKIKSYMSSRFWDFSILDMIYEGLLFYNALNYIGKTFIKRIASGETFTYIIKDYNREQWLERLVTIRKSEVESFINAELQDSWFLYGKGSLCVS